MRDSIGPGCWRVDTVAELREMLLSFNDDCPLNTVACGMIEATEPDLEIRYRHTVKRGGWLEFVVECPA